MADFHEREKGGEALNIEHLRLKKEGSIIKSVGFGVALIGGAAGVE